MSLHAVPMTITAAKEHVRMHHRHNKPPAGGLFAIGVSDGEKLVGVAIVGRPIARRLDDGSTCEVTRCCVIDGAPKGACSFLYARAWRAAKAIGYRKLITYTLQSESGASLRGAGWKVAAQLRAGTPSAWLSRPGRDFQHVVAESKFRWEAA